MSRLVVPPTLKVFEGAHMDGRTPNYQISDDYQTRLAKYIPTEATGGYVALENLAKPLHTSSVSDAASASGVVGATDAVHQAATLFAGMPLWPTLIFFVCLIFAPLYVYVNGRRTHNSAWLPQAGIAAVAFMIWAYAINGQIFQHALGGNNPQVSGILLVLFSMGIALYQPRPVVG